MVPRVPPGCPGAILGRPGTLRCPGAIVAIKPMVPMVLVYCTSFDAFFCHLLAPTHAHINRRRPRYLSFCLMFLMLWNLLPLGTISAHGAIQ